MFTAYSVGWLSELPEEFVPLAQVLNQETGEELQSAALPRRKARELIPCPFLGMR